MKQLKRISWFLGFLMYYGVLGLIVVNGYHWIKAGFDIYNRGDIMIMLTIVLILSMGYPNLPKE